MMCFVFYKTNDVFAAEELLQKIGISVEIVPTPVQDKAYCGVCVKINDDDNEKAQKVMIGMEFKIIK